MKKLLSLLLTLAMILGCVSFASAEIDADLIKAAQEEGELIVYGSCEEPYLNAAARHFEELYGIKVYPQRLSTGEVQAKITEEAGNPSADVFGWTLGVGDGQGGLACCGSWGCKVSDMTERLN